MSNDESTLLTFPCDFALKAMGVQADDFADHVADLVRAHLPESSTLTTTQRSSNGGRYQAVTVRFEAHSREQLDKIYHAVTASERVKMAL